MPPVGFESTISPGERPKTYALDRAATETGWIIKYVGKIYWNTICLTFVIIKIYYDIASINDMFRP